MRTDIPGLYGCIPRSSVVNVEVLVYLGGYDDRLEVVASSEQCPEGESDGFHTIGPNEAVDRPWGIDVSSVEVRGGAGDDVIHGGPAALNEIFGESGNDDVETFVRDDDDDGDGGSGNDRLDPGAGNDTGVGGTGNDTIDGREGNDNLQGHDGDDALFGRDGDDTLDGGLGNDTGSGGAGNDQLRGRPGSDVLNGGEGDDVIRLDDGNASAVPTPDETNCGAGRDTVYADSADT